MTKTPRLRNMHTYLYAIGNNGHILEVQGSINLVHHVQWRWLEVVQSKHLAKREECSRENNVV